MKKNVKILAVLLSLITVFSLTGCQDNNNKGSDIENSSSTESPESVSVSLDQTAVSLTEDETITLKAMASNGKSVSWASDNPTVATVSATGKVIAKRTGVAIITAAIGSSSATCMVTVMAAKEKSADYIVAESSIYMSMQTQATAKIQAVYMAVEENGAASENTDKKFTYESLNDAVATVSETGEVIPVGIGSTDVLVRCGDVETYVFVDVYSRLISNVDEWNDMLCQQDMFARYYVTQDIDFSQREYNAFQSGRGKGFTGELNGGYHTISNVEVVKEGGTQSLLGGVVTATVKNIAFANVHFTAPSASGICDSLLQHRDIGEFENCQITNEKIIIDGKTVKGAFKAPEMDVIIFPSYFTNVLLDASFVGHGNVGFCQDFYGGMLNDVYINMRRGDSNDFNEADYALCRNLYIWNAPNVVNNTVIRYDAGKINTTMERLMGSYELPVNNIFIGMSEMEANYSAYQTFDASVWSVTPTGLPTFQNNGK